MLNQHAPVNFHQARSCCRNSQGGNSIFLFFPLPSCCHSVDLGKKINTPKEAKIKIKNTNWVPEAQFKCNIVNVFNVLIKCFVCLPTFKLSKPQKKSAILSICVGGLCM